MDLEHLTIHCFLVFTLFDLILDKNLCFYSTLTLIALNIDNFLLFRLWSMLFYLTKKLELKLPVLHQFQFW